VPEEAPDRVCGPEQMVASCREGCKLLQAFVDRELDEDTARVIAAHLDDCRRCGLEAEMYRRVQDSLRTRVSVSQAAVARLQEFAYALEDGRAPSDAE
jgi:anti-sigma factor RsiW